MTGNGCQVNHVYVASPKPSSSFIRVIPGIRGSDNFHLPLQYIHPYFTQWAFLLVLYPHTYRMDYTMLTNMFSLAGKRGIVTGASRGLGRAMAEGLASMGADLVIAARTAPALEEAAHELSRHGGRIIPVATDTGNDDGLHMLAERTIGEFGGIDFVFANAGVIRRGPAESLPIRISTRSSGERPLPLCPRPALRP